MAMVREQYAEPESFGRLLSSIDAAWIEEALAATGTATIRKRRLPAEQVVWLVLGMALYRDWNISRVVIRMTTRLAGGEHEQTFRKTKHPRWGANPNPPALPPRINYS
jgi:hypothetical protein